MVKMRINETRDKIVSVADRLFGRFGFQKTSMDEIAKIARKAKGSLYYHFSSKEDLFKEVVQNEIGDVKLQLSPIVNDEESSAEKKLVKYLMTRMDTLQNCTNYHETLIPGDIDHFEFMDDVRNDFDEWEKFRLTKIINEGVEQGEFHIEVDAEVLSDVFIMILKGLEIPLYIQGKYEQYLPHIEGMTKMLTKGMS